MNWLITLVRSEPEASADALRSAQSSALIRMARFGVFGWLGTRGSLPAAYATAYAASLAWGLRCICTMLHNRDRGAYAPRDDRGGETAMTANTRQPCDVYAKLEDPMGVLAIAPHVIAGGER